MATFGERLKSEREKRKLSQQELASRLNISQSSIAYYEKNRKQPPHPTLIKIANHFDVSIDYLLGETDNPSTTNDVSIDPEWVKLHDEIKQKGAELEATALLRTASKMTADQLRDILKVLNMIDKD